jgi:predicted CXXCH cytochrome family protein
VSPGSRVGRLAVGLAVALALSVAARLASAHVGLGWEFAQLAGLAGALLCLALFAFPVRPRLGMPAAPLSLRAHELIGWTARAAVLVHGALTLLVDPHAVEYLKPTTPLYQWAGIAALLLVVVLTLPATGSVRRRIWSDHRNFQALHVILGCALLVLTTAHVLTTDRYAHGPGRWIVCLALTASVLAALIRGRQRAASAPVPPTRVRAMVFGRHSGLVLAVVGLATVALLAVLLPGAGPALREPLVRRAHGLADNFPHEKHRVVNCIQCHHNYTDGAGLDTCIGCHRSARADLKRGVEARFHVFCLGCHRDPDPAGERHGPVSGCATCHGRPGGVAGVS